MPRFRIAFAIVVCLSANVDVAVSQAVTPLGELQVNTYTSGAQAFPVVGVESNGDFIVAWSSGQDGSGLGVFARRFNAAGVRLGNELQVNAYTSSAQRLPAVGIDDDGDFVVAWQSLDQDGSSFGVFARRFNSGGVGMGAELQVNAYTSGGQLSPTVGMDGDGDFVVAWQSYGQDGSDYGVFARRFNAAGVGLGAEFQVSAYTSDEQSAPAVGLDGDGDFVVAWASFGRDGDGDGVFARRFNSAGGGLGAEFQVNAYTTSTQGDPAVGVDTDGDFVVAWNSIRDGSGSGVFARRFFSGGGGGVEFQVNIYTSNTQRYPAVDMDGDGNFVVAWYSEYQDGSSYGVFARRFNAVGQGVGTELQVSTYTTSEQAYPAVGIDGDGDFVVAWHSNGQDGSDYGVFAQRFATLAILDIDGNGSTGALTDGLLVLRSLFGFTGATLVTGAVDVVGCTRCDAPTIQAYLQTLL